MFHDWLETNQIPKSAIALWHGLMHIANKAGWERSFTVAISTIESKTGFKRSELFEARNILSQKGRINWKQRGGNLAAEYEIIPFCVHNTDAKAYTSADASTDAKAYSNPTQKHTINKLNKTKLNKTKHSFSAPPIGDAPKKEDFSTVPFWKSFVNTWDEFYQQKTGNKHFYQKKDFGCLKKIYDFLKKRAESAKYDWTEQSSIAGFKMYLNKAYEKDEWLRNNFSIPNILSQFNQIANGQQSNSQNGNPATGASVSTSSAFEKIDSMPG